MSGRVEKNGGTLLKDLQRRVKLLETDLRERAAQVPEFRSVLEAEYREAREADRTAMTYDAWLGGQVTQSAVAWVLSCVFLRFAEDNALIKWPFLSGPGERLALAEERQDEFFRVNPQLNDRDWIIAGFRHLAKAAPAAKGLFDERHNPLWRMTPSFTAATELLGFWRQRNELGLEIRHSFYNEDLDTRFLGDLYQDLSEETRETYALFQTPEFVEEFVLDLTLTPALTTFGLSEGFRLIDPTCGSGHFLLGAFSRLLDAWRKDGSGEDDGELIRRALRSVNGVDKNPFAAAIARFRLLIASMQAAGKRNFAQIEQYELPIRVAVADSLWHAAMTGRQEELRSQMVIGEDGIDDKQPFAYVHEDIYEDAYADILKKNSYHAVVGNPPYPTVKDKAENAAYRRMYSVCSGQYALSVPFAQLFFELALLPDDAPRLRRGGYVGQITSNSFMKREFGKRLIEKFFAIEVDLTHIIDTSGAYIPGHGTPTVILVGQNRTALKDSTIRAVLGVRGEPSQPEIPADGIVWRAIVNQVSTPSMDSDWVTVEDVARNRFATHPWSISGGGAGDLKGIIENASTRRAERVLDLIGFACISGADEAYFMPPGFCLRNRITKYRNLITGEGLRDYLCTMTNETIWPYENELDVTPNATSEELRKLWPNREILRHRKRFGIPVEDIKDFGWYEYRELYLSRFRTPTSLVFASVSTHNHFVLDRGGSVFNRHAPVIKLPEEASEDDHLALLGVLNSSTACFWLKQVSQSKGGSGIGRGVQEEAWEDRYEFTGTKLEQFPLPVTLPLELGRKLDAFAQQLATQEPSAVCEQQTPTRDILDAAKLELANLRAQMIAWQEELDWETYGLYGLLTDDEAAAVIARPEDVPNLNLGERAFEIILAREVEDGTTETQWFTRHNSTPRTDVPFHWSDAYRKVVEARIALINSRPDLALIERPECKRRWATEPWEKKEREALRSWLLDRCENKDLWFTVVDGMTMPRPLTVNKLADLLDSDPEVTQVAALYARDHLGKPSASLAKVLEEITADEHVPYLAAYRYRPTGLRKRADWEQVWKLQREEDRTDRRVSIPVPPKYISADFAKQSYWRNRGKLDVSKERFISYPAAAPDGDPMLLLGWAGWNHRDQAHALTILLTDRINQAGWGKEQLTPLIAGLKEIIPWVEQWYNEEDPAWNGNPAEQLGEYLRDQRDAYGLSDEALAGWKP